jgi:hypothetical protein
MHPPFPSNRTGWGCYVIAPQSLGGVRRLIVALITERLDTGHVTNMPRSGNHPSSGRMGLAHLNECNVIVSPPQRSVGACRGTAPSREHARPFAMQRGYASRGACCVSSGGLLLEQVPARRGLHYGQVRSAGYVKPGRLDSARLFNPSFLGARRSKRRSSARGLRAPSAITVMLRSVGFGLPRSPAGLSAVTLSAVTLSAATTGGESALPTAQSATGHAAVFTASGLAFAVSLGAKPAVSLGVELAMQTASRKLARCSSELHSISDPVVSSVCRRRHRGAVRP